MFLRDSRLNPQTSRLTSANLQAHTGSLTPHNGLDAVRIAQSRAEAASPAQLGRNSAYSFNTFSGYHGEQNLTVNTALNRNAYLRPERFGVHRGALRSNDSTDSDSNGRGTPDSVAAIHGTQADDDLESTITSASRFLADAANHGDESRTFFDPYSLENAPQTPASVYTVNSSVVSSSCDNVNEIAPPYRVFGDLNVSTTISDNIYRPSSENRTLMRNQAENAIDPHRTHQLDVANNAWSSSPVRSSQAQHEAVGLRREMASNALAQHSASSQPLPFASGASRKRPFLADCDYSNEFDAPYGAETNATNANVAQKRALNSNEQLYKRSNSQQPQQANFHSLSAERERERDRDREQSRHPNDAFLTPPVIKSNPFLYTTTKHPTFADLQPNDSASSCASWAPAPSPAPPHFSSSFQLNLSGNRSRNNSPLFGSSASQKHLQQPRNTNKDCTDNAFVAPASPPSPFKQPGLVLSAQKATRCTLSHNIRPDLEAKFKEYNRNNSLIEKFGLNFSSRRRDSAASSLGASAAANAVSSHHHENVFKTVNEFICQFGNVTQKRSADSSMRDGRRPDKWFTKPDAGRDESAAKEQDATTRLGILTSELLDQFRATREFKKPDVYRSEAKRLKHFADSVTSGAPNLVHGDVQSLMVALVKIGTYTETVLVFILCAAAMESKPKRYKAEQCAEFYSGLLPLVQYVRNLAQTYQASRLPNEEEYSGDPLADLLFFGAHSVSYLIDSYLHVKMFDARKSALETSLQRIDDMKTNLKISIARDAAASNQPNGSRINANGELSDSASNTSISSGYLSNLSSPLIHRNAARNAVMPAASRADLLEQDERYSKERADEKNKHLEDLARYDSLSDQYEAALRDMALICRAFDLREEAFDLVRKIRALNIVCEGEHKRKWKRIVNFSKWPPFSIQHLALDEFISYVRMFTSTLMSTVLALTRHGDQQLRKKR